MEFDGLTGAAEAFRNSFPGFSKRGLPGNTGTVDAIPALVERGTATVMRFYRQLDDYLATSKYIAGDTLSIADITALCGIDFATGRRAHSDSRRLCQSQALARRDVGAPKRAGVTRAGGQ